MASQLVHNDAVSNKVDGEKDTRGTRTHGDF